MTDFREKTAEEAKAHHFVFTTAENKTFSER